MPCWPWLLPGPTTGWRKSACCGMELGAVAGLLYVGGARPSHTVSTTVALALLKALSRRTAVLLRQHRWSPRRLRRAMHLGEVTRSRRWQSRLCLPRWPAGGGRLAVPLPSAELPTCGPGWRGCVVGVGLVRPGCRQQAPAPVNSRPLNHWRERPLKNTWSAMTSRTCTVRGSVYGLCLRLWRPHWRVARGLLYRRVARCRLEGPQPALDLYLPLLSAPCSRTPAANGDAATRRIHWMSCRANPDPPASGPGYQSRHRPASARARDVVVLVGVYGYSHEGRRGC